MGEVKVQSHKVCPTSYRFTSHLFCVNRLSVIQPFQHLTLKIQGQGCKPMMLHTYRFRQFYGASNVVNLSSSLRDICFAKSGHQWYLIWQFLGLWASPCGANEQMTIMMDNVRSRQFHKISNGENSSSSFRDMRSEKSCTYRLSGTIPKQSREVRDEKSHAFMMTSSNGNIFRVTGHLYGEFTGPRWIPRTKASDAELWYFLWSAPE